MDANLYFFPKRDGIRPSRAGPRAHHDDENEPDVEDVGEAGLHNHGVVLPRVRQVPFQPSGPADEGVGEDLNHEDDGGGGAEEARAECPAAVGRGGGWGGIGGEAEGEGKSGAR